ncbi:efflux RND transporter periplasmic adaptor subunit [Lysobacter sp. SG-8]|uniref:Efflux RND transporter periplasmic adaptor subunit n=1 Tax=Marilutibacter penaei TaxID=2759900 RepID=A0A7W3U1F4_9GAMM|nr:efflux RND transporter periplasmic adaptor subunit [Lysobacter penaei]MBB1087124.1 efflux RND transporter periplasmic adaptor subunit [Lysobacter penaei]
MNASADLLKELRIDRTSPPPPESRRGLWVTLAVIAVVLVAAIAGWWLFGREAATEVRTTPAVAIGGAGGSRATSVLDASGYVVARRIATVSAKVTGRVREVLIEEGQRVEAGDVMARLDPVDADAQQALARSQLEAARSQISSIQAQLTEAESNAQRLTALAGQQLVSKAQHDQAIAQRDALRAQLLTARRNATVASEQVDIADIGVDNTIVRAPFGGVVIAKAAQPGEIISPLSAGGGYTRTGIGTIVDMDSLEVEVDVNEAFIGRVQPGMPVEVTLNAYPDWKIPADVIAIIPAADRGKATVKVRIGFKEKDPRIVPDMGARVSFLEQVQPEQADAAPIGVLVPGDSVVEREGLQVAFVVSDDTARQRAVQVGRTLGDDLEVTGGLSAGDRVVLSPPDTLADGAKVNVVEDTDN